MEADLRSLPAEVIRRIDQQLGERGDQRYRRGIDVVQRGRLLEARATTVELRRTEGGDPIIDGYATVWEQEYDVAGGPPVGWTEVIAEGAATKSLREKPDVKLLFDHEGIPLARTRSGTLVLDSDDVGLHVTTPDGIDSQSPHVRSVASAMERGDLDEMSFAFRALRNEWNADYTRRRITEVQLFDVSVVTYPANPATVAQLRTMSEPDGDESSTPAVGLAYAQAIAASLRG